ncbi:hypothetical protein [Nocardioides sp.]|uniref:hypothetical protein n=1 Tax=Nocardioides sp. TaxID=35761 RepID=UPI0039E2B267
MSTISFRADEATEDALRELMSDDVDRSTVIREAILDAWRHKQDERLRAEALAIADNPADRAEIQAIHQEFEDLRAW